MNLPECDSFPARPKWPEIGLYAPAALGVAGRYFQACEVTPDSGIPDGLTSPPILHFCSIHGVLTAAGIMIACDHGKPFAVITPWGQWIFTVSGREARGVVFLGNPTFTDGLTLGEFWSPGIKRIQLIPVLGIGNTTLPEPELYRYTGPRDPAGHAARQAEWYELVFGIDYAPPGVVERPSLRTRRLQYAAATG